MIRPIERLSERLNQRWLRSGAFVVATFIATIPLLILAQLPSPRPGLPGIALEFPGTANTALAILRAVADAGAIGKVHVALLWDLLLIVAYVATLTSLLEWLGRGERRSDDELRPYAIVAVLLAGALDVVEDIGIWLMLPHATEPHETSLGTIALITTLVALLKWTLILAAAGYSLWELSKRIAQHYGLLGPGSGTPQDDAPPGRPGEAQAFEARGEDMTTGQPVTTMTIRYKEKEPAGD